MDVNDVIAERIAAAKWRAEQAKKRRQELAEARAAGLVARHRAKLARLADLGPELVPTLDPADNTTFAASGV